MNANTAWIAIVLLFAGTPAVVAQSRSQATEADATAAADYKRIIVETLLRRMKAGKQPVMKGTALVRFTIERSGLVTASSLAGSSGNEDLDRIALGVVPAGLKLLPFLPQMARTSWTITAPFRFGGE